MSYISKTPIKIPKPKLPKRVVLLIISWSIISWSNGNYRSTQVEKTTVQSTTTAIKKGLEPLNIKTDPKSILGGLMSQIIVTKTKKKKN
jgi:hypothetical protein